MIELTIKAESGADLIAQMISIAAGLSATPEKKQTLVAKTEPEAPAVKAAVEPVKAVKEVKEVKETSLTIETIRAAIADKSKAGKRDDIKALLKEFGASRATDLTTDQYAEFNAKLSAL